MGGAKQARPPPSSEARRQHDLLQAEAALRAIRDGDVDHLIVSGPHGPTVVSLLSTKELELLQDLRQAQALAKLGTWTYKGGRIHWSQQMYVLHRRDETLGPPARADLSTLFVGTGAARLEALFDSALKTGQGFDLELELAGADSRWCRMHAEPTHDAEGRITGLRGTAQDMTVSRKAEAERERVRFLDIEVGRLKGLNEMRTEFLNAAAHDLNNPLTPIMLQLAVMAKAAGNDEPRQSSIRLLQRNFRRLQVLIQDMLVSSRLQSGRMTLKRKPTDLHLLLQQAIESFEGVASAGNVKIHFNGLPTSLSVDEERISQVLYNLLSNAVKYTPAGGAVHVALTKSKGHVGISVTDSGLGMTPAQLDRLFHPFVRLHEHVGGSAKGTGLGLYICKGLVEAHGGRIWATSAGPGRGSTFNLELPTAGTR